MVAAHGIGVDGPEADEEATEELSSLFERIEGESPVAPAVRRLARTDLDTPMGDGETEAVLCELEELLADDRIAVQRLAAAAGARVARASPEVADRWFAHLRSRLEDDATERRGLAAIERLARERPELVRSRIDSILARLERPRTDVRRRVAGIASVLAETDPEALAESVPTVVGALAADDATDADPRPGSSGVGGTRSDDRQFLERDRRVEQAATRAALARTLAAVTRAAPEESAERVVEAGTTDALRSLLADDQPLVRAAAVGLVGSLAETHPDVAAAATPALVDSLDDDAETVRGGAILALGALASHEPATLEALGRLARTDGSDRLRELAGRTLDELESTDSTDSEKK